ncbi:MAG TPA: hypothetical protein VHY18_05375 [Solirubrobacteraceae bacterium]|jgi:hypothetical protein|nr:hypothetical protein [Solirubrobacteraceae bacterium]
MSDEPLPIDQIPILPLDIGIEECRGQSVRREKIRLEERLRTWTESPSRWRRLYGRLVVSHRRW